MPKTLSDAEMEIYFSGSALYGDNLPISEIQKWFADEAEGYFMLGQSTSQGRYAYGYHALNRWHGFAKLPRRRFRKVLGVGSAYGDELLAILPVADDVTVLEPSDGFKNDRLNGVPLNYVKPLPSGDLPFDSESFDLLTCFGVLHHIPNVSKVISELFRVLRPGAFALIREPIISMGDWRQPRVGLTKRERGIPLGLMRNMVKESGFSIVREHKCMFSLTSRLAYIVPGSVFNYSTLVSLDAWLSALPIWSSAYHARNVLQKLRPTSVFYVLEKPGSVTVGD